MTGKNSHIDYAADCEHIQVQGLLTVWNSTSEAMANFHSWNLTSNNHNLTISDASSSDAYKFGGHQTVEIYFIRGNVTAGLRCDVYQSADLGVATEELLLLALAQDMKILQMQGEIEKSL